MSNETKHPESRKPHWLLRLERSAGSDQEVRKLVALAWYQRLEREARAQGGKR